LSLAPRLLLLSRVLPRLRKEIRQFLLLNLNLVRGPKKTAAWENHVVIAMSVGTGVENVIIVVEGVAADIVVLIIKIVTTVMAAASKDTNRVVAHVETAFKNTKIEIAVKVAHKMRKWELRISKPAKILM
jgi:hypothetical protein